MAKPPINKRLNLPSPEEHKELLAKYAINQRMAEQDEKTAAFKKSVRDVGEFAYDALVPQTLSDVALEAAFAPAKWVKGGLKAVSKRVDLDDLVNKYRQATLGAAGVTYTPETEGAVLEKLLRAGADTMKSAALAQPASKQEFLKLAGKTHTDLARALERKAKDPRYSMLMRDLLEKYEVFDPQKAKEVYDSGHVFVGSRGVTFGDIDARSAKNTTPGIHFAPAGQERQVADILAYKQSIDAGKPDYDPKVGLVAARIKNPILVSDREAEFPAELATKLELVPEFREMVASGLPESEAITVLARRNGVGPLIYGNKIEGVKGRVNPSISIIDPDDIQKFSAGGLYRMAKKYFDPDKKPKQLQGTQIVKEPGGNWLAGSVEDALTPIRKRVNGADPAARLRDLDAAYAQNVEAGVAIDPTIFARERVLLEKDAAINRWIDKQLTRYVKNEMATPEDPIRALAERGVLHFEPRGIRDRAPIMDEVVARRLMSGNPATERAVTPLGEQWERYADSAIMPQEVQELGAGLVGENPWLAKMRPTDTVYKTDHWRIGGNAEENLGFNHLIDELRNALNPESGLPRHLLLDPKSLERVSVPQAVERVAKINAWRAAQKAEADLARANNAATVLHKEYPDKGFRWVELTGKKSKPEIVEMEGGGWRIKDNTGHLMSGGFKSKEGAEKALAQLSKTDKRYKEGVTQEYEKALEDALKYEGDTMGHCVGGYCDDVLSGRSRIFSLRDAKGEPHVTIETRPPTYTLEGINRDLLEAGLAPANTLEEAISSYKTKFPLLAEEASKQSAPSIIQIKGKQNRAPNPEYLPFVQDFVRSGEWSDVGDLHNTGLVRRSSLDAAEARKAAPDQEWFTQQEIDALYDDVRKAIAEGKFGEGFAAGGLYRMAKKYRNPDQEAIRGTYIIKEPGGQWLGGNISPESTIGAIPSSSPEIRKWLDTKLRTYVKNEMGTKNDPIRKLAEEGVTPTFLPRRGFANPALTAQNARQNLGFPALAKSELAKDWEDAVDASTRVIPAGTYLDFANARIDTYERMLAANPWLAKVPPETPVHSVGYGLTGDFSHMADELANMTNPASGLPPELMLDPEKIGKLSVEDVVRRVDAVNKWREANRIEADALRSRGPATFGIRDYPESGLQWVEIKKPVDPKDEDALQKALTYEGDTMGHCVGGYCNDVLSGRSRIYSLRDTKGQPHVTIEVRPGKDKTGLLTADELPPEELADMKRRNVYDPGFMYRFNEQMGRHLPELGPFDDEIVQIKGKANRAPNPEYMPAVQDFVRSQNWSNVGDLKNTGLVDLQQMGVPAEMRGGQRFVTEDEYKDIVRKNAEGFAAGGLVGSYAGGGIVKRAAKNLDDLVEKYVANEALPTPEEHSMLQGFYRGYAGENKPAKTAFGTETYFVSPQRKVGEYYAKRRAAEKGEAPHLEMIMADPFALRNSPYKLGIPLDKHNRDTLITNALRIDPNEIKNRIQLYADGGVVDSDETMQYNPTHIDSLANQLMEEVYGQ